MTIKESIARVVAGEDLSSEQAAACMACIASGEATPSQTAALVTALRIKGETYEELTGFARVMREKSLKVDVKVEPLIDTCGTGGDKLNTFNISTASAFVVA